jgi:hypothetical protein
VQPPEPRSPPASEPQPPAAPTVPFGGMKPPAQ